MVQEELIAAFRRDRWLQHTVLFPRRHPVEPAPVHPEIVADFWSDAPELVTLGFRGLAKSTYLEEGAAIGIAERQFRNCLIIGASESRAEDRVRAIARELLYNEDLIALYGEQKGAEWTQSRIVTGSERAITGLGRGQDIRGIKFLDWRPDLILVDDFEDAQNVLSPEGRERMLEWFLAELLPVCDPGARVRVYGTPMAADSVPMRLKANGWPTKIFPILYRAESGDEQPIWPARYPADWIERRRRDYISLGKIATWNREYMCDTEAEAGHDFKSEYFRVEPHVRTWQPCWAMIDPARTTKTDTSAMTGIVVFSWIGPKLVVWEDRTGFYSPSEIIDHIFQINDEYKPIFVGFERNGLDDWAEQPIRQEQLRRGRYLPLKPMLAPRDKLGFIRGLEPFFRAREIVFATDMPELRRQFLSFPTGRIDGPNALAYAPLIRPGIPIYENFRASEHLCERIFLDETAPMWLAANTNGSTTTAVLAALAEGRVDLGADWVRDGDPGAVLEGIVREARLEHRGSVRFCCPQAHFNEWHNHGLVQAASRVGIEVSQGGQLDRGRSFLRSELGRMTQGRPAFQVAESCRWALAALNGGYARLLGAEEPEKGIYRLLMEGLESFLALAEGVQDDDAAGNFAYDGQGRRYRSVMPAREGYRERRH